MKPPKYVYFNTGCNTIGKFPCINEGDNHFIDYKHECETCKAIRYVRDNAKMSERGKK